MKLSRMALFAAVAVFGCGIFFPARLASAAEGDAVYLGGRLSRGAHTDGVWQSYASIGQGEAASRFAFESGSGNKFLRMANFDGAADSVRTSATFSCAGTFEEATVSFSYRLFEGEGAYGETSPVFTAELRGATHAVTYGELTPAVAEDLTWRTVSFTMTGFTETAGDLTVVLHFAAGMYAETRLHADLDNVSVRAGGTACTDCDFDFAAVGTSDEKVYETLGRGSHALMLSGDDIALYEENTELGEELHADFNDGLYSAPLARQGSEGTFHTAASANAGGSDIYAVYDGFAENTFLRLANFNGTTEETQLTTYFYDNEAGTAGNLPVTDRIYYSFRYRLYIDDYIRAGMRGDETILHLSTRSSVRNHTGEVSLDELVCNEQGDDTWHTYESVLDVVRSSTSNLILTYYAHAGTAYSHSTFLDLDDLRFAATANGANYADRGGTFDGLAEGGESLSVFFREELGTPAGRRAKNSLDGEMLLPAGGTFSLHADMPRKSNVFYAAFDVGAEEGATLALYLGGRSGDKLLLTVGQDAEGDLSVAWEKGETWRCRLYYARAAYGPVTSWDFVNTGTGEVSVDNFRAGQVVSVGATAGDSAAFLRRLGELKAEIEETPFTTAARLDLARLVWTADHITEFGSEARMQSALDAIEEAVASLPHRADMTALEGAIAAAEEKLAAGDSYEKAARLRFLQALSAARNVTDEDGQDKVDRAAQALRAATDALVDKTGIDNGNSTPVVAIAAGASGAAGIGSVLGACLTKRRFL